MQQIHDPRAPEPGGRAATRRPVRIPDGQAEIADLFARYAAALDKRLQKSLDGINHSATKIMRQLVAEVWRAGGPSAGAHLREGVLGAIAHDDALRGLLSHTDERYQALSVRMDEMENAVRQLAEATREAVRRANRRAVETGQPVPGGAEAINRIGRAFGPLAQRLDAVAAALGQQQKRQRDDLTRFAERTAQAMAEVQRRLHQGIRSEVERVRGSVQGELQRLEAAVLSERAFGGDAAAALQRSMGELGERTGNVLEGLRRDVQERLSHQERTAAAAARRSAEVVSRVERRLDALGHASVRQHRELSELTERTAQGMARATERLLEGLRQIFIRVEAAEARSGSLESAMESHREQLAAFAGRAGRGLSEMSRRIHEGFRVVLERSAAENRRTLQDVETSIRREVAELRSDVEGVAGRTGQVLESLRGDLAGRVERSGHDGREEALNLVTKLVTRQGGQHAHDLEAIARSLQALLESVRRSGEGQAAAVERVLRSSARRQEALLDEALGALRGSIEELSDLSATAGGAEAGAPPALTRRLRGVEQRLAMLSRELVGEDPASGS